MQAYPEIQAGLNGCTEPPWEENLCTNRHVIEQKVETAPEAENLTDEIVFCEVQITLDVSEVLMMREKKLTSVSS